MTRTVRWICEFCAAQLYKPDNPAVMMIDIERAHLESCPARPRTDKVPR